MTPGSEGKYKIGTVCRLTGFTPATLRAWEKRHGLLAPKRGTGGQRLFTDADLRVLYRVRELIAEGRSIGEIALTGRETLAGEVGAGPSPVTGPPPPRPSAPPAAATPSGDLKDTLDHLCREIVHGALQLDGERIERSLADAFSLVSPELALSHVVEPAAASIGVEWGAGRCSVAGEHLASSLFARRLRGLMASANVSPAAPRPLAICACFPDEQHELGVMVVSYYLFRMGLRTVYLGACLPFEDLEVALTALRPDAVYLSVTRAALFETHKPRLLDLLVRWRAQSTFLVGGGGVPAGEMDISRAGGLIWPQGRPARELGSGLFPERRAEPHEPQQG